MMYSRDTISVNSMFDCKILKRLCPYVGLAVILLGFIIFTPWNDHSGDSNLPQWTQHIYRSTRMAPHIKHAAAAARSASSEEKVEFCPLHVPDPWDPTILQYVRTPEPIKCSAVQPQLTDLNSDHELKLDHVALYKEGKKQNCTLKKPECYYACFGRNNSNPHPDFALMYYGNWSKLKQARTQISCSLFKVHCICVNSTGDQTLFYMYTHYNLIRNKTSLEESDKKLKKHQKSGLEPLSVMLIVLDSVSHSNFIRQMPQTMEYLTDEMGAFIMDFYTKVGDNSLPNAIAFLLGKIGRIKVEGIQWEIGNDTKPNYRDDWPIIWKDFKNAGYMTFYEEDWHPEWHLFSYGSKGFINQPTDHYLRPFWMDTWKSSIFNKSNRWCYDTVPRVVQSINHMKSFISAYKDRPKFVLQWFTELAHDHINNANLADVYLSDFLREMKPHLNNTVLFVFADHGHRFDPIRVTPVGRLEERLPFFSIALPEWLKNQYPELSINLQNNREILSSPFDIYITMQDILQWSLGKLTWDGRLDQQEDWSAFSRRGLSVLRPLDPKRTCEEAGIAEVFCLCRKEEPMKVEGAAAKRAARVGVAHLNKLLEPVSHLCSTLRLAKIRSAEKIENSNKKLGEWSVRVMIQTEPGDGVFEVNVAKLKTSSPVAVGDVNRITRYHEDSLCVKEKEFLRKLCYCKIRTTEMSKH